MADDRARRLQQNVRRRAGDRCEYCRAPVACDKLPFQMDHVVPRKHGGASELENLAWSCFDCNVYKGPNLAGLDPDSGQVTPLFNPRHDQWIDHFRWDDATLLGLTAVGRATIAVL